MGAVPLPELDIRSPQPESPLELQQRAAALKSAAAQEQIQQQQAQALAQQNEMQAMALKDAQLSRSLGPQFVQTDDKGNRIGFDWDGYNAARLGAGVNPNTVRQDNMARIEMQQKMMEFTAAQHAQVDKMGGDFEDALQATDNTFHKNNPGAAKILSDWASRANSAAQPATPATAGSATTPVPGQGSPATQPQTQVMGQPAPGEAPTAPESAIRAASENAGPPHLPIDDATQAVYQQQVFNLMRKG